MPDTAEDLLATTPPMSDPASRPPSYAVFANPAFDDFRGFVTKHADPSLMPGRSASSKEEKFAAILRMLAGTPCLDMSTTDQAAVASLVDPARHEVLKRNWQEAQEAAAAMKPAWLDLQQRSAVTRADHLALQQQARCAHARRQEEQQALAALHTSALAAAVPVAPAAEASAVSAPSAATMRPVLPLGTVAQHPPTTPAPPKPPAKAKAKTAAQLRKAYPTLALTRHPAEEPAATPVARPSGTLQSPACSSTHPSPYSPYGHSGSDIESIDSSGSDDDSATPRSSRRQPAGPSPGALTATTEETFHESVLRAQLHVATCVTSMTALAMFGSVVHGGGFAIMGLSGSTHVAKSKMTTKGALVGSVTAVAGPFGGAPTAAVLADGYGLTLIPQDPAAMDDWIRLMGDIQFATADEAHTAVRLSLMAVWETATRTFRRRLTEVLGSLGDGPWAGHSHPCALYVWVIGFIVLHRAMAHTMLVDKDPSTLPAHLEKMWGMAYASGLFNAVPTRIATRELLAALQLCGLFCEVCHTAGALSQICWKCKRNTFATERSRGDESAYQRALTKWQQDDPARQALKGKALSDKFRASPEGKAVNATSSAAPKVLTSDECMQVIAKNLNKITCPLHPPIIRYK